MTIPVNLICRICPAALNTLCVEKGDPDITSAIPDICNKCRELPKLCHINRRVRFFDTQCIYSAAGQILLLRRNRISDDTLEKLLILNNDRFFNSCQMLEFFFHFLVTFVTVCLVKVTSQIHRNSHAVYHLVGAC